MPRSTEPKTASRKRAPGVTRFFLFSDLRGYTDYVEQHGDASAARLLRDYRTLVRREVARHAGAEVKTEGDSFYVVFDSASAALDCAVDILRRAETRNHKEPSARLTIGMGLHAGETVSFDQQFVGGAVNVASRLAAAAGPSEILVSDTLRGLVRTSTAHAMSERGPLQLKGVTEGVRAWSVDWREPTSGREIDEPVALPTASAPASRIAPGQLVCPVVIGRDGERARLRELVTVVAGGRGQTLLLSGEAGVGKSAFVRDATAVTGESGFRLLYGATLESDSGLPYAPFLSAVRSGFRGLERDRLGRVLAQAAPDLAELFPELGRPRSAGEAVSSSPHRLALAFHGLFATFAREAPVLLVIEDLHWADEASLALLQYLSRELRDSRVLILATYRTDEMHRRHPFLRTLAALQRERLAGEIALKRLTPVEVTELIRATLAASDPTVRVSDEFRDAIYTRSEGNPFFTEELLKSLVESGDVYRSAGGSWERKPIRDLNIPGSIRESVRTRVERLSPEARTTLAAAAVVGQQFTFDTVRAACDMEEGALESYLREFIEQQLVIELSREEERYAFRHALTREVIYDDLLIRERKRLHRRVADALAKSQTTEPGLLAYHLLAAGESERAVPYLLDAAAGAARAGAPREAAAHYERAIDVGMPDDRLADVIEHQAEAYHLFDVARSIEAAQEAIALYRGSGDRRGESRMLRLAGRGYFYESRQVEAERLTQEAIDVLAGEECPELGRAVAQLAGLLMARVEMAEALPLADRAIALGERFADHWTLANALITKGSALRGTEGMPFLRRGLDVALRNEISETALRAYNNILIGMIGSGASGAERHVFLDEGLAYARRRGIEQATLAYLLSQKAFVQFGEGEWEAALATANEVHDATQVHRWSLSLRGRIVTAREGPEAALPVYAELARLPLDDAAAVGGGLADLAAGFARAGRLDEARGYLGELADRAAQYPRGVRERPTPRSLLGGPALTLILSAALYVDAPSWVEEAEVEIGEWALGPANHALAAAARAIFAGEAGICAQELAAAREMYAHVGLAAFWHGFVVSCARAAAAHRLALGPEWASLAAPTRAFADPVGARWWVDALAKVGL
ncbi:MAG TPA: AAA family ATPase [Candidatus Limnocylindria bacterium]|nr:AAA family ATPase [Candidatus Limnocylindria bacterium]